MLKKRVIDVILIKDGCVVQSENFRHLNVIHYDTKIAIETFSNWSVDEILLINVAKKNDEKKFIKFLDSVLKKIFVPISVGGWIKNLNYASDIFSSGADKICVNSGFFNNIKFAEDLSAKFGKQSIICSIDYKKNKKNLREVFINQGKKDTGHSPIKWAKKVEPYVGEFFLTSIDHDGMRNGYDKDYIKKFNQEVKLPTICFGGVSKFEHFYEGIISGASAVAAANFFHYNEFSTIYANQYLKEKNIPVRDLND